MTVVGAVKTEQELIELVSTRNPLYIVYHRGGPVYKVSYVRIESDFRMMSGVIDEFVQHFMLAEEVFSSKPSKYIFSNFWNAWAFHLKNPTWSG